MIGKMHRWRTCTGLWETDPLYPQRESSPAERLSEQTCRNSLRSSLRERQGKDRISADREVPLQTR